MKPNEALHCMHDRCTQLKACLCKLIHYCNSLTIVESGEYFLKSKSISDELLLFYNMAFASSRTETPKVTNRCGRCNNKLDFGEEYICCTDCAEPYIMDKASKLGYCKSGAQLAMQLKPQGHN